MGWSVTGYMLQVTGCSLQLADLKSYIKEKASTSPFIGRFGGFCMAIFCLMLVGCATTGNVPTSVPYTTAAELLHIMDTRYDSLRSLQTRAQITLKLDGIRENRAGAGFLYRAPDQLRIDIGSFGVSIMTAVANQNKLEVYLPRDNNHLVGQPEKVLRALTGVNLAYYNLNHAVLGLPNVSPLDLTKVTQFLPGANQVILELNYTLWKRKLVIDRRSATLLEDYIFDLEGKLISKRLLSEYYQTGGFVLPKHIEIHQGDDLIAIDVKTHLCNRDILDGDFRMLVPGDVRRHDIE